MCRIALVMLLFLGACQTTSGSKVTVYKVELVESDTLENLARRFDTSVSEIVALNRLSIDYKPRAGSHLFIKPGANGYLSDKKTPSASQSDSGSGFWSWLFGDQLLTPDRGLLFDEATGQASNPQLAWPLQGPITSPFGSRWGRPHEGIDIDGVSGQSVRAAAKGRVTFAGWKRGYGRIVELDHGAFRTRYAHLKRYYVTKGAVLEQGEKLGEVGSSGRSTGSHLHFEVRVGRAAIDPLPKLQSRESLFSRNP